MKILKFELSIKEGNDEFWDNLTEGNRVLQISELIKDALYSQGMTEDYDYYLEFCGEDNE